MPSNATAPLTRGHAKKMRTRTKLLEAGLSVLRSKGERFIPKDVTDAAGVSTGTFYNYFSDTNVLIDEIMRAELLKISSAVADEAIDDPAMRIAVSATRILQQCIEDPLLSHFVLRLVYRPGPTDQMTTYLRRDLIEGVEAGRFSRGPDHATLDMASGLLILTIRRLVAGDHQENFIAEMVERLLEAFGLPKEEARQIAKTAPSHLEIS